MKKTSVKVPKEFHGSRIDQFLVHINPEFTRSRIKNLIRDGHLLIDGKVITKAGELLEINQLIEFTIPNIEKLNLEPICLGISILYEDDDLAVVEKPAGLSVHPSTTENNPTLVHGLLAELSTLSSVGGIERPGIVHRIDKGTSGILVVSKNDVSHYKLSTLFKTHDIDRKYIALVYGKPKNSSGTIKTFFGRSLKDRKKMTGKLQEGRQAITHWKVIQEIEDEISVIECTLETGRTHQIRVHLSEMGHTIVGDPLYGDHEKKSKLIAKTNKHLSELCKKQTHQMLHAYRLGFVHPRSGKNLVFEVPLTKEIQEFMMLGK